MKGRVRQQIKAWLKSGVIDSGTFTATSEGTPQGGVISPLLANIALHGLEQLIELAFPASSDGRVKGSKREYGYTFQKPTCIRYADDFVVLCEEKAVIQRCREMCDSLARNQS